MEHKIFYEVISVNVLSWTDKPLKWLIKRPSSPEIRLKLKSGEKKPILCSYSCGQFTRWFLSCSPILNLSSIRYQKTFLQCEQKLIPLIKELFCHLSCDCLPQKPEMVFCFAKLLFCAPQKPPKFRFNYFLNRRWRQTRKKWEKSGNSHPPIFLEFQATLSRKKRA